MKALTSTALAAVVAVTLGGAALAPTAFAAPPDTSSNAPWASHMPAGPGMHARPWAGNRAGMRQGRAKFMALECSPRGAEALEIGFVRAKYALHLTADQSPLFAALRTSALDGQRDVAKVCRTQMAGHKTGATLLDKLQGRLAIDQARVTALSAVIPKFEAFYQSLDAGQKKTADRFGHWRRTAGPSQWGAHKGMTHRWTKKDAPTPPAAPLDSPPTPPATPSSST